jgi:hypothetical protein
MYVRKFIPQEDLCGVGKKYFDSLFEAQDGDHELVLNLIQLRVMEDDNKRVLYR